MCERSAPAAFVSMEIWIINLMFSIFEQSTCLPLYLQENQNVRNYHQRYASDRNRKLNHEDVWADNRSDAAFALVFDEILAWLSCEHNHRSQSNGENPRCDDDCVDDLWSFNFRICRCEANRPESVDRKRQKGGQWYREYCESDCRCSDTKFIVVRLASESLQKVDEKAKTQSRLLGITLRIPIGIAINPARRLAIVVDKMYFIEGFERFFLKIIT